VYAVEYIVDGESLSFAVTDADKNLIIYSHQVNVDSIVSSWAPSAIRSDFVLIFYGRVTR
jgi:hypothetical protein